MKIHFNQKRCKGKKKMKTWKTKEEKGDNILRSCESCQEMFFGDLRQTWANSTTTKTRNEKKNALVGYLDLVVNDVKQRLLKN